MQQYRHHHEAEAVGEEHGLSAFEHKIKQRDKASAQLDAAKRTYLARGGLSP
jgi:hypothetical protein